MLSFWLNLITLWTFFKINPWSMLVLNFLREWHIHFYNLKSFFFSFFLVKIVSHYDVWSWTLTSIKWWTFVTHSIIILYKIFIKLRIVFDIPSLIPFSTINTILMLVNNSNFTSHFFKTGIPSMQGWTATTWDMELQKKKKHKTITAYRKFALKEPTVKRCLLILDIKPLRSQVKGKHSISRKFQNLAVRGKKLLT